MKYNDIFHLELGRENDFYKSSRSLPSPFIIPNLLFSPKQIMNNQLSTTDTDNSLKNFIVESKETEIKTCLNITIKDKFIKKLFDVYSEDNCLCNFLLFEKSVDLFNRYNNIKNIKRLFLNDYFDIFIEYGITGINIPFIKNADNLSHNVFIPTLSSMIILIKPNKIIKYKSYINTMFAQNNLTFSNLSNDIIKIEFNETNPYYFRDNIDIKLNKILKLLGKKKIKLDDIINKGSYLSVLWTSASGINIVNTSFLSFYSFDFNYIGSLIIKKEEYNWLSCLSISNRFKDFKNEYINKAKNIENFIHNCNETNLNNINKQNINTYYFAYDVIRYFYNLLSAY